MSVSSSPHSIPTVQDHMLRVRIDEAINRCDHAAQIVVSVKQSLEHLRNQIEDK